MTLPSYDEATDLLKEYTKSESLIKHMLAVEAAMRAYARKFDEDEDLWGLTGLMHDFDYEIWPNPNQDHSEHPFPGIRILREKGYPESMLNAILGHAQYSGVPREKTPPSTALSMACWMVRASLIRFASGLSSRMTSLA